MGSSKAGRTLRQVGVLLCAASLSSMYGCADAGDGVAPAGDQAGVAGNGAPSAVAAPETATDDVAPLVWKGEGVPSMAQFAEAAEVAVADPTQANQAQVQAIADAMQAAGTPVPSEMIRMLAPFDPGAPLDFDVDGMAGAQIGDEVFGMEVLPEQPTTGAAGGGILDLFGGLIGGDGPRLTGGNCCPDGNCICREGPGLGLSIGAPRGRYRVSRASGRTGRLFYPSNAEPPFAGIAICPGFLNFGPEMNGWGDFYASHGIAVMVTNTSPVDLPIFRAAKLLAAVDEMKAMNNSALSAVNGKMAGRYGTSGYSMGGGGTTIAANGNAQLKTSVALAAWGPNARGTRVPSLFLCGSIDIIAPCGTSRSAYNQVPAGTPKAMVTVGLAGHLAWFSPSSASGRPAIAWQKVYLEGDTRWKSELRSALPLGSRSAGL